MHLDKRYSLPRYFLQNVTAAVHSAHIGKNRNSYWK